MQKIPRPMNCFLLFRHDKQKEILTQCPGANHRDISKIIAKWWKEATEQEKAPYVERARKEKVEHARLYPSYKYMPQKKSKGKPRAYKRKTQNEFTSKSDERNHFMKMIYQNRDALNHPLPSHQRQHYDPLLLYPTPSSSPSSSSSISSFSTSPNLNSSSDSPINSPLTKVKKNRKYKSVDKKISSSSTLSGLSLHQYPSPICRSSSPLQHVYCSSNTPLNHIPYNNFYESLSAKNSNNNTNSNNYITNNTNTYNNNHTNLTSTHSNNNNNNKYIDNHPHHLLHHHNYMNKSQLAVNEFYLDNASNFYNISSSTTQFAYSMATPPPTFTNYVYTDNNTLLNTTTSMGYQEIALDLPIYPNNYLF